MNEDERKQLLADFVIKRFAPLFICGLLVTAAAVMLAAQFTTSTTWAVSTGVTVGVLWMLLCAHTVDVIRAQRHDPTNNGDGA